MIASKANRKDI